MNTTLSDFNRWLCAPREDEHLEFREAKSHFDVVKIFRYCVAIAKFEISLLAPEALQTSLIKLSGRLSSLRRSAKQIRLNFDITVLS